MPPRQSCAGLWTLVLLLALLAGTCMGDTPATGRWARAQRTQRMRGARPARMRSRPQRPRNQPTAPTRKPTPPFVKPQPFAQPPPFVKPPRFVKPPAMRDMPVPTPPKATAPVSVTGPATMAAPPSQVPPDTAPQPVLPSSTPATPPAPATQGSVDPAEGDLRLVAQRQINGYTFGGLQIFLNGAFGAVCGADFRNVDAGVACRQLGFIGGGFVTGPSRVFTEEEVMEATAPIVLEVPECLGSEDRLLDCPMPGLSQYSYYGDYTPGPSQCTINDEFPAANNAYIACGSESGPEDGQIRLVGGATSEDGLSQFGRLEFANAGGWGLVCDSSRFTRDFSVADAQVACRSLGFTDGIPIKPGDVDDEDLRLLPVWLSSPSCVGNERSLLDCPSMEEGFALATFCSAAAYVELSCFSGENAELDGRLRLAGGTSGPGFEFGRLEIFIRGFWSTICDNIVYSPNAAVVACRILGFDGGATLRGVASMELNESPLPPGISNVDCDGSEASLLDCVSSNGFAIQNECSVGNSPANDATVLACSDMSTGCDITPPAEQGSVRLVGGFGTPCDQLYSGIVEVFNDEDWGAICNNGFGREAPDPIADVVCRQLGFPHGNIINALVLNPEFDQSQDYLTNDDLTEEAEEPQERFWLPRDVECQGAEQRLVDCDLGRGFLPRDLAESGTEACTVNGAFAPPLARLHVACTQFSVP